MGARSCSLLASPVDRRKAFVVGVGVGVVVGVGVGVGVALRTTRTRFPVHNVKENTYVATS